MYIKISFSQKICRTRTSTNSRERLAQQPTAITLHLNHGLPPGGIESRHSPLPLGQPIGGLWKISCLCYLEF